MPFYQSLLDEIHLHLYQDLRPTTLFAYLFVVILKSDYVLDTVALDNHNRFLYEIKGLQSGFYTFKHGSEIQMVFLEPNDSIMFRLNTLDFDESLVYTGDGAKKNNYFIDEFLQNETEEKKIFQLCQLDPKEFEKQITLIKEAKNKRLKTFINKNHTSHLFGNIAQANINYNYYSSKEIYPLINYQYEKRDILSLLPNDYYNYRKDIDYNQEAYKDYLSYNSFLRTNFNNLTLEKHLGHSQDKYFNGNSICYNLDRLKIIDSLVSNPSIKNDLLYYFTMTFLTKNKIIENNGALTNLFLSTSTDSKNNEIITNLSKAINNLKPGGQLPDIKIVDFENSEITFSSLINKPTAIYFWSHDFYQHFKESHYKVSELKKKYPEVNFIAVNIDIDNLNSWSNTLKKNRFSLTNEYHFKTPEESMHTLAIYPMTKVILIDKDNIIVNSNSNMFASNFEEQLLGIINK